MNVLPRLLRGATTVALLISLSLLTSAGSASEGGRPADWLSPTAMVASPDGRTLFIACATANRVLQFDTEARQVARSILTPASPTGLTLSPDGATLYVTCAAPASRVCVVDVAKGRIATQFAVGHTAMAPVLSPDGKTLYVCNRFNDDVSVVECVSGKELRRIPVQREPVAAVLTPDGRHLLVANHLHHGRANADQVSAVVSVIDTAQGRVIKELSLPNGSGALNDIRISPDGRYAVVTHILARFHLPTTQLDRGWMNTNAETIIALDRMEVLNTVLVDSVDRGAANPWGFAWSADGRTQILAHAGTHEISVINFPGLLDRLATLATAPASAGSTAPYRSAASRTPADVPNDLSFLVGLRERRRLPEGDLGPRAVAVAGQLAFVANYFSATLSVMRLDVTNAPVETIPLGSEPALTPARRGELAFHDARICFQGWQSCASCHPGGARVDALNWDLLNDGVGNPKNNKSLLLAHQTPPAMSIGIRESAETAVRAGIRHILFTVQPPEVAEDLDIYLKDLKPVPSPHLVKGKLSPAAKRGQKLFRSQETGCLACHPGPLFTDMKPYNVGTGTALDKPGELFDTPTLVEIWRTAPYLHDGSAATMRDVLTTGNRNDAHGRTSHLSPDQIRDLEVYLLSL